MARPKQRATIERDENKRISIIDVAREAGVSPATVSRVLHNKPIVDPKVRDMVRETVARMNYRPSFAARNLPMGRTGYLALATPRGSQNIFTNPYVFPSLEGIGKVVDESSFHLIIATTPKQISNLLETHAVDGMILIQFQMDDTEVEAIEKSGIPAVVVGAYKQDTRLSVLTPDYPTSVQIAVEHLAKLGHREIGFICGPPNTFKWRSNQIAFGESIQQLGLREVGSLVTPKYTEESGYTAFRSLTRERNKTSHRFCFNLRQYRHWSYKRRAGLPPQGSRRSFRHWLRQYSGLADGPTAVDNCCQQSDPDGLGCSSVADRNHRDKELSTKAREVSRFFNHEREHWTPHTGSN